MRVLLESTQKIGAATNVQNELILLHDLYVHWRLSDNEHFEVGNIKIRDYLNNY